MAAAAQESLATGAPAASSRLLAAAGALLLAAGVALAAYAAHGAEDTAAPRLNTAAAFAFGHGLALAALAPQARSRLATLVLTVLLVGTLFFCGGVATRALWGASTGVAPLGGSLLIAGWLAWAGVALRGRW